MKGQLLAICLGLSLWAATPALANLTLKMDLEGKIQDRLRAQIVPFDPYAQVLVTARLKKVALDLPGTNLRSAQIEITSTPLALSSSDIEGVDITIVSRLDPMPESLKKIMESSVGLSPEQKHFHFQKMDLDTSSLIHSESGNLPQAIADHLDETNQVLKSFVGKLDRGWMFLLGILAVLAFQVFSVFRSAAVQARAIAHLSQELVQASEKSTATHSSGMEGHGFDSKKREAHSSQPLGPPAASIASPSTVESIRALTLESQIALLSDCYWCEEDGYAAFLWSEIAPGRREEILSTWPIARTYGATLVGKPFQILRLHEHPYYLKPFLTSQVSQSDLLAHLRKNPEIYRLLSPMRTSKLGISLLEKLKWESLPAARMAPVFTSFPASGTLRALSQDLTGIQLTNEDEEAIGKNPGLVPIELRSQIRSLIWLSLLDEKAQVDILNHLSAQNLAEVWIGPESILNRLRPLIPEKKLKIAQEYGTRFSPSRNSAAMSYVIQEALARLKLSDVTSLPMKGPRARSESQAA